MNLCCSSSIIFFGGGRGIICYIPFELFLFYVSVTNDVAIEVAKCVR